MSGVAIGYVRQSEAEQGPLSPRRQRDAIQAKAKAAGYRLVEVVEEIDRSAWRNGGGKKRPGFESIMQRLGEIDAVIFTRVDRVARSARHLLDIAARCDDAGVALVAVDQSIDTSSAMGRFQLQLLAALAELESGILSERTKKMHAHKKAAGEHVGRVPFGWQRVDGRDVVNPPEFALLREAAERYVAGQSYAEIAADLNTRLPDSAWVKTLYEGSLIRMMKSERVRDALPKGLAAKLITAMDARVNIRVKPTAQSLLAGIATCSVCGGALWLSGRGRNTAHAAQYSCRNGKNGGGHANMSAAYLEPHVRDYVFSHVGAGQLAGQIGARRRAGLGRVTADIEARLEAIDEMLLEGKLTQARYDKMNTGLLQKLEEARKEEREAGAALPAELVRDLPARWDGLDVQQQRTVIRAVCKDIIVKPRERRTRIVDVEGRVRITPRMNPPKNRKAA